MKVCVCVSLLLLIACDRTAGREGGDLAKQIERVRMELTLPKASGTMSASPDTKLRVSVTPEGVLIEERGPKPSLVFIPSKMLEAPLGLVQPLHAPLLEAKERVRNDKGAYELAVDARVTYDVVAQVMYNAGQAEWSQPYLVFSGEQGDAFVELLIPKMCAASAPREVAHIPTCELCDLLLVDGDKGACARPTMRWVEGGVQVEAFDRIALAAGCEGLRQGSPSASLSTTWKDTVVSHGACPSAPDKLEEVLDALDAHASLCEYGELAPGPKTTFAEVAGVIARLVSSSTIEQITLSVSEVQKASCQGAFVLGKSPTR